MSYSVKKRKLSDGAEAVNRVFFSDGRLKRFRDQGLITLTLLEDEKFSGHYVQGLFGPEQLLHMFEKLFLVAKVSDKDYLMPCLLPHMEGDKIAQCPPDSMISPLLLQFPKGGPPPGVFYHLLAYLIRVSEWKLVRQNHNYVLLKRNSVAFYPNLACQVIISDSFLSYIQISIITEYPDELPTMCRKIRDTILYGVQQICANLGLKNSIPEDAFYCSAPGSCSSLSPHPATLMSRSELKFLSCTINQGTYCKMTGKELLWFTAAVMSSGRSNNRCNHLKLIHLIFYICHD